MSRVTMERVEDAYVIVGTVLCVVLPVVGMLVGAVWLGVQAVAS